VWTIPFRPLTTYFENSNNIFLYCHCFQQTKKLTKKRIGGFRIIIFHFVNCIFIFYSYDYLYEKFSHNFFSYLALLLTNRQYWSKNDFYERKRNLKFDLDSFVYLFPLYFKMGLVNPFFTIFL